MNAKLSKMLAQLHDCDSYTQVAVYMSWQYIVNSQCINTAMRFVPEVGPESGIDGLGRFEQARIAMLKDADNSPLPSMIGMQRTIEGLIIENAGRESSMRDTLAFMTNRPPIEESFAREFEKRRREGMRPGLSKKDYIEIQYKTACQKHDRLIALGSDAIRLCETVSIAIDTNDGGEKPDGTDLPEWMIESFENKMIEKLNTRWMKIEITRTNPRMPLEIRDGAEADQLMISKILETYGVKVGLSAEQIKKEDDADKKEEDDFLKAAGELGSIKPVSSISHGQ